LWPFAKYGAVRLAIGVAEWNGIISYLRGGILCGEFRHLRKVISLNRAKYRPTDRTIRITDFLRYLSL
jgi:hypothetical protein